MANYPDFVKDPAKAPPGAGNTGVLPDFFKPGTPMAKEAEKIKANMETDKLPKELGIDADFVKDDANPAPPEQKLGNKKKALVGTTTQPSKPKASRKETKATVDPNSSGDEQIDADADALIEARKKAK